MNKLFALGMPLALLTMASAGTVAASQTSTAAPTINVSATMVRDDSRSTSPLVRSPFADQWMAVTNAPSSCAQPVKEVPDTGMVTACVKTIRKVTKVSALIYLNNHRFHLKFKDLPKAGLYVLVLKHNGLFGPTYYGASYWVTTGTSDKIYTIRSNFTLTA